MRGVLVASLIALAPLGCGGGVDWEEQWLDARDERVSELVVSTYHPDPGGDHCGWESVIVLHLGWPLGTAAEPRSSTARQYVRDAEGELGASGRVALDLDTELPPDADYTGYSSGELHLWISPSDANEAVYVVRPGRVERWPRSRSHIFCD
jgi:hypothetical protein